MVLLMLSAKPSLMSSYSPDSSRMSVKRSTPCWIISHPTIRKIYYNCRPRLRILWSPVPLWAQKPGLRFPCKITIFPKKHSFLLCIWVSGWSWRIRRYDKALFTDKATNIMKSQSDVYRYINPSKNTPHFYELLRKNTVIFISCCFALLRSKPLRIHRKSIPAWFCTISAFLSQTKRQKKTGKRNGMATTSISMNLTFLQH